MYGARFSGPKGGPQGMKRKGAIIFVLALVALVVLWGSASAQIHPYYQNPPTSGATDGTPNCQECLTNAANAFNACLKNRCKYLAGPAYAGCYLDCQNVYTQDIILCHSPLGPCD